MGRRINCSFRNLILHRLGREVRALQCRVSNKRFLYKTFPKWRYIALCLNQTRSELDRGGSGVVGRFVLKVDSFSGHNINSDFDLEVDLVDTTLGVDVSGTGQSDILFFGQDDIFGLATLTIGDINQTIDYSVDHQGLI